MMSAFTRFLAKLSGTSDVPDSVRAELTSDEQVLAVADSDGGPVVATHLGLWLPESAGHRRLGWHLISKATWRNGRLGITEAVEDGTVGEAVLLRDLPVRSHALSKPGRLPEIVHARVTGSIKSSHQRSLPGGDAWFVQRKVPGQDGIVLQVRAAGVSRTVLTDLVAEVDRQLREIKGPR